MKVLYSGSYIDKHPNAVTRRVSKRMQRCMRRRRGVLACTSVAFSTLMTFTLSVGFSLSSSAMATE
jgi:hypothetical protein